MASQLTPQQAAQAAARVASGEREVYALLVDAYQSRVRALVAGYCNSAEQVEETCHLAFVEAYVKIDEFDPQRGAFSNWLLTIARNCLLAELRRRKSEGERAARYLERAAQVEVEVDGERLEATRVALEKCLAELGGEENRLVAARYAEKTTSDQLAARLSKTAGAVRMRLQRIRERLRACIQRRLAETEA
jgi:RNA polymerase sigma-70 factor, ECF subfamily